MKQFYVITEGGKLYTRMYTKKTISVSYIKYWRKSGLIDKYPVCVYKITLNKKPEKVFEIKKAKVKK